jgi:branched-chain amino acid transport system substrate-binding protein
MSIRRPYHLLASLVVLLLLVTACGQAAAPTAPAPTQAAKPTAAATQAAAPATATAPAKAAEPTKPAAVPATTPATAAQPAAGKEILVGLFGPMSGAESQYGKNFSQAISMATDDLNRAGGIGGRPVKIVESDDRNDPKEAATIAQKYASDSNMMAVLGGFSSAASLNAAPIFQKAGIVQLCPTCSHPEFTKDGEYIFSLSNPQADEGPFNAKFTANTLGKKKVAVLWRKDDWGLTAKDNYERTFKELGGEVVLSEGLVADTKDWRPVLTKIKDLKPDVLYIALFYQDAAVMTQQAKQLGLDIPIVAAGSLYNIQFVKLAQDAAEGIYLPTTFFPNESNPKAQDFAKRYKEKYGVEADNFAAHAYDSALVLFEAMKKSDLTRKSIRDALAQTKDLQLTTGVITFDANRRVHKDFTWLRVKGSEFVYYKQ